MTELQKRILSATVCPVTYLDIEEAAAAILKRNRSGPLKLGTVLTQMVNDGHLHCRHADFKMRWPVYCVKPISAGRKQPLRGK